MEERMLTMRVEGEAITQIAREQCYYSRKFDSAMNILIASLQNEELEEGEIAGIALSILDGRAEIKGTYPDGDYRLEYLEAQDEKWKLGNLIDKIARELEQQKKDKQTLLKKYLFVLDSLEEWEKRSLNDEYFEEWNERLFEDIPARAETQERGGLLESFLKRMSDKEEHTTEDYGWLEPNGTFHGVEWGEHSKWADDWLRDNLTEEEYEETDCKYRLYNSGDALVDRGWILLHNPSQESAIQKRTRSGKKVNDMIGKITVQEAAAVLHVSQQFVRIGMQERVLPIGTALKMSSKWTYNITEGKLAEYAGVDLKEEIARIRGEGITA